MYQIFCFSCTIEKTTFKAITMKQIMYHNKKVSPSKVVCIGRNYVEHIHELGTEIPENMVVFNKPNSSISDTLNFISEDTRFEGIWDSSWRGIRIANICIENIEYLLEATQEQKDLILGQAYFFRAFFHWEVIRAFGGMPYIDKLLSPNDNLRLPRLSYQESTEKIVKDLDAAIPLLPDDWDLTETGAQTAGANRGRATKGAALAVKCKALLYAASPLMNNESTG